MSSSTASSLRQPRTLAELLDARPDTREMVSANLNLAHACLILKQGDSEEISKALDLARRTSSPGLESIATCIEAERLRQQGKDEEAWEMAQTLTTANRFDTVAALYLRYLFPFMALKDARESASIAAETSLPVDLPAESAPVSGSDEAPATAREDVPEPEEATPPPASEETPSPAAVESAPLVEPVAETSTPVLPEPEGAPIEPRPEATPPSAEPTPAVEEAADSEVSIALDAPPVEEVVQIGEFPLSLSKVASDESVQLLHLSHPDDRVVEMSRGLEIGDLGQLLRDRPGEALANLGFGRLLHASFDGASGSVHSWSRNGNSLVLVVQGASNGPALAARCTRAMEDLR